MGTGGHQNAGGPLVALTGATGFLGSHIADALLARGYRVRASIRATSSLRWLEGKPVETRLTDLTDPDDCASFLAGTIGLIHNAGIVIAPDEEAYHQGNVATTEALRKAAGRIWEDAPEKPGFVLISSLAAHGPAGLDNPAVESGFCRPITGYGRSKLAAELLLGEPGLPFRAVILRPPSLYGPRDREFLPLLNAALKGWTIRPGSLQGLSLVDGRDAANAAVTLLESPRATGAYFVDDGRRGYSFTEMADVLQEVVGRKVRLLTIPLWIMKAASLIMGRRAAHSPVLNRDRIRDLDASGWVCDGDRLASETGFRPLRQATAGLVETLAFYREEGWL